MPEKEDPRFSDDPLVRASHGNFRFVDRSAEWLRSWVVRFRKEPEKYYHRRFNRVPTIDQCGVRDEVCRYEADQQLKRDKQVDENIVSILRRRYMDCRHYWGTSEYKCDKQKKDFDDASENYFIKYGDVGINEDVVAYYMKQKHRLIWERRQKEREQAGAEFS